MWTALPAGQVGLDQRPRLPRGRRRDGVQADGVRPSRWRTVNAPHLVTLVRAGATFEKGKLVKRVDTGDRTSTEEAAA